MRSVFCFGVLAGCLLAPSIASWADAPKPSAYSPLASAIQNNRIAEAQALVEKGAPVNEVVNEYPLLDLAISFDSNHPGGYQLIESMITHGADVNAKLFDGSTPLFYAIYQKDLAVAQLLISKGADVNAKALNGTLSTFAAAMNHGDVQMADLLAQHGASQDYPKELAARLPVAPAQTVGSRVAAETKSIMPAPHYSDHMVLFSPQVEGPHHALRPEIQYLMVGPDGCTLRDMQMDGDQLSSVDYGCRILPGRSLDSATRQGGVYVSIALPEGPHLLDIYSNGIKASVESHALAPDSPVGFPQWYAFANDPLPGAQADDSGPQALHFSVKGLDCTVTAVGRSASRCAVASWDRDGKFIDIVASGDFLKQPAQGVVIHLNRDGKGWTMDPSSFEPFSPVLIAVKRKDLDAVNKLIAEGADLDVHEPDQDSPVDAAFRERRYDIAAALVSHGADPGQMGVDGRTALLMDISSIDPNVAQDVALLLSHGADPNRSSIDRINQTPLLEAIEANQPDIVRMLLEHHADANGVNKIKWTPLVRAISAARDPAQAMDYTKLLLDHGADPNLAEKYGGGSPLMVAVMRSDADLVEFLIAKGADVNAKVNLGDCYGTAYHCAEESNKWLMIHGRLLNEMQYMMLVLRLHGATGE